MLQATAATFSEKRALRFHAVGTFFKNLNNPTPRKIFLVLRKFDFAKFTRQAPLHKTYTTIGQACHSFAALYHFFYVELINHITNIATRAL